MSLLEGIIKFSFGTSYKVKEGIQAIKKELICSKEAILNNIPVSLLQDILPHLKDKDVSITLKESSLVESIEDDIRDISYHSANIHAGYGDEKMQFGCIVLPKILFDIIWNEEGVRDISAIKVRSCLKCDIRTDLCGCAAECGKEFYLGGVVDIAEGIELIKNDLKKSSKAIINYLPDYLIEELLPFLQGKDIRIMMPYGHRIDPDLESIPNSRISRKLIRPQLKVYDHNDAMCGGVCFPHIHYGVAWKGDEILEIRTLEVEECVRCMVEKHITAWSFGKRIRS